MSRWILAAVLAAAMAPGCGRDAEQGRAPGQDGAERPEADAPAAAGDPADEAVRAPAESRRRPRDAAARPRDTVRRDAVAREAPPPAPERPSFREVTLPAGTTLRLELTTAVASDKSEVEDAVRATLTRAVVLDDLEVLPEGTEVAGVVTDVERAGRVKGRARVAFRFTSLRHDGERYDIRTQQVARTAEATKGKDATKIAVGAGAGAALGAVLGGGSGAAKGAAVGGAAGTGAVLATRGKEVRLGPGVAVTTELSEPVTLRIPFR